MGAKKKKMKKMKNEATPSDQKEGALLARDTFHERNELLAGRTTDQSSKEGVFILNQRCDVLAVLVSDSVEI